LAPAERASTTRTSLPSVVIMMTGTPLAAGMVGESFEEFEAVHHRHVDVAEDDVERAFLNFDESFGAVAGFEDFAEVEAGLAQGAFDDFAHYGGVVHD
jgi:hypothetical protein